MATIFNDRTGAWENATTWHRGVVPSSSDDVVLDNIAPRDNLTFTTVHDADEAASLTIFKTNFLVLDKDRDHDASLTISGEVLIKNGGVVNGGGELDAGSITNQGRIDATSARWHLVISTDSLVNSGGLHAIDGATLEIDGNVTNAGGGVLQAGNFNGAAEILVNGALNNSGTILSDGGGTLSVSGNVTNSNAMYAQRGGVLNFHEGVTNLNGGTITAFDHSTIKIGGSAIGGTAILAGNDAIVAFNGGASTMNVRYHGGLDEQLILAHSLSYSGSLSILPGRGDSVDARDISFHENYDFYNPTTRILTVGDGTQTAEIKIAGTVHYTGSDFSFSGDHHGGTLVGFV